MTSALDREVTFKDWDGGTRTGPIRKILGELGRTGEMAQLLNRQPVLDELVLWEAIDPVAGEPGTLPFVPFEVFQAAKLPEHLFTRLGREGGAWATAVAERLIAQPERLAQVSKPLKWLVMLALARAGVPIEERWDVLLPMHFGNYQGFGERIAECFAAVPAERRAGAILGALAREKQENYLRSAIPLLQRFPSAELARAIADMLARKKGFDRADDPKKLRVIVDELAKRLPVLAEALAAASSAGGAKAKAPAKAPALTREELPAPASAAALTAIDRKQLEHAGTRWDGDDAKAEVRLGDDEERSFAGTLAHCRYLDAAGKALYDGWYYQGDSGTIYRSGTTTVVAEEIQGGLQSENAELVEALTAANAAARKARKAGAAAKPAKKAPPAKAAAAKKAPPAKAAVAKKAPPAKAAAAKKAPPAKAAAAKKAPAKKAPATKAAKAKK